MHGAWFSLLMWTSEAPPQERVVDMVVARVNDAVITLSELVAQTGILVLEQRGPQEAADAVLPESLLRSVLDATINEVLLHQEVRRLQLDEVPSEQVLAAFHAVAAPLRDSDGWRRFLEAYGFAVGDANGPPPLWSAILRRRLAVEALIEARSRVETRLSAGLELRCYEANAQRFAGRSFADAKSEIEGRIRGQIMERTARKLVNDLRRRAEIRIAPGFEPTPSGSVEPDFTCPIPDAT